MHQFTVAAAMGMSVASCAGTIKERMAKFEGLPLSAVIAKIGFASLARPALANLCSKVMRK
jgi:hypothetical protein